MSGFAQIAFTPTVQALQEHAGSRAQYARMQAHEPALATLGEREANFIAAADSFYMATISETGWPYVQHRGGPIGFVKVLGPTEIAFADFRGNVQYVSVGNTVTNDRVALIMVDYMHRQRLKLLGRLRFIPVAEAGAELLSRVQLPGYRARIERVAVIALEAFDWNCPQHITQRFTLEQVEAASRPLRERVAALEAELARVRGGGAAALAPLSPAAA